MKKIILFLSFLMVVLSANAQKNSKEDHRERIKNMKVAYFTQELNMSPQTAQIFWPIYNAYECQRRDLHRREDVDMNLDNIEKISEAEAEEMLKEYLTVEREEYEIKKELFSDLKQFFSSKEIIKLHKIESDFNKKLIREYRERKSAEKNK